MKVDIVQPATGSGGGGSTPTGPAGTPNANVVSVQGITSMTPIQIASAGGLTVTQSWSVAGNYTYADSRDRSPGAPSEGRELYRRPPSSGNLSATYCPDERLASTLAARFAGRTFDDPLNRIRLAPYVVVDLRASYNLTERLSVYGRVENIADRHYEVAYQYGTYGRGAFIGFGAKL